MARRAGQLRERVYFERREDADDGYGTEEGTFARLYPAVSGSVAAEIMPVRGREQVLAARLTGTTVYEITVRWCTALAGLKEDDRCVNDRTGEIYNIRAIVNPDMKRRWLALTCEAGVAT